MPESEIRLANNSIDPDLHSHVLKSYPLLKDGSLDYHFSVLSPIVKLQLVGKDAVEFLQGDAILEVQVDVSSVMDIKTELCLAEMVVEEEKKSWVCLSREPTKSSNGLYQYKIK